MPLSLYVITLFKFYIVEILFMYLNECIVMKFLYFFMDVNK